MYLRYLGLLEPSDWLGDHLVISPCSVATLTDGENLTGHGNSRGLLPCDAPHHSASGLAGLLLLWPCSATAGEGLHP